MDVNIFFFKYDFLSSIQQTSVICHENTCKDYHYAIHQHFTFCSFTVLNKLKALQGMPIDHQTSTQQKYDTMDRSHLNQKHMKKW